MRQATFLELPTNTGSAINQGWEVEGTWLATDELTINANYSLTKTEYQDDVLLLEGRRGGGADLGPGFGSCWRPVCQD